MLRTHLRKTSVDQDLGGERIFMTDAIEESKTNLRQMSKERLHQSNIALEPARQTKTTGFGSKKGSLPLAKTKKVRSRETHEQNNENLRKIMAQVRNFRGSNPVESEIKALRNNV